MNGHSRISRFATCFAILTALIPAGSLLAQFNDWQPFDGPADTIFAVPDGSVPYWSVADGCSGALNVVGGTRGDNGSKCLKSLMPPGVGTRMVRDLTPGPAGSTIGEMAHSGLDVVYRIFLSANDGSGSTGQEFYRIVGGLYPVLVLEQDINPGPGGSSPANLYQQWPGGLGNLFFSADDGTHGREPWLSFTADATVTHGMIMDVNPGPAGSDPSGFSPGPVLPSAPRIIIFAADDGTNGRELWTTERMPDGTSPSTNLLKDINASAPDASSDPQQMTPVIFTSNTDVKTFFTADDGVHGRELWRTDGSAAGTGMVRDFMAGAGGSNPSNLRAGTPLVGSTATPMLLFTVDSDGANGQELWKSLGRLDGSDTVQVKDFGASPTSLVFAKSLNLFFLTVGNDLWKCDGTTAGTVLLKTFAAPPTHLADVSHGTTGFLYFAADDGNGAGVELWKASATAVTLVKDINPGSAGSSPTNLCAANKQIFFSADDGTHGRELWRTDTAAGAVLVKDINVGPSGSDPSNFFAFDWDKSLAFFTADDGIHGRELWESDGFEDPPYGGMNYKWDWASLIQSKTGAAKDAVVGTDDSPLSIYWLFDNPTNGGTEFMLEAGHQVNTYVELTDGVDRVPFTVTSVDCGDGNLSRPRVALTDGSNHNAIAFGMVAVLDQDPCDKDPLSGGSPGVPFAHVPAVYDGHDWIPMDRVHFPPGVPTNPPSGTSMAEGPWANLARNATLPADLVPATGDPWASKRFTQVRMDVWHNHIRVVWASKNSGQLYVATLPRQYTGAFKALYFGNRGCMQPAYPFYLDTLQLYGGVFTTGTVFYGACCEMFGDNCTDVPSQDDCPNGRFKPWASCADPKVCCPVPFADVDYDGDVDQDDFGAHQACYTGIGGGVPSGCGCLDSEGDGDVDAADFTAFDECYTGPNVPWSQSLTPQCSP